MHPRPLVVSFDPGTSLFRLGRIDQRFERNHLNVLIYIETFSNANTTAWRLLQCSHHYCSLQSIMHMLWIAPVRGISWRIRGDRMSSLSMGRGEFNRLFQNQWIRGGGIRDNCWLIHGWATMGYHRIIFCWGNLTWGLCLAKWPHPWVKLSILLHAFYNLPGAGPERSTPGGRRWHVHYKCDITHHLNVCSPFLKFLLIGCQVVIPAFGFLAWGAHNNPYGGKITWWCWDFVWPYGPLHNRKTWSFCIWLWTWMIICNYNWGK